MSNLFSKTKTKSGTSKTSPPSGTNYDPLDNPYTLTDSLSDSLFSSSESDSSSDDGGRYRVDSESANSGPPGHYQVLPYGVSEDYADMSSESDDSSFDEEAARKEEKRRRKFAIKFPTTLSDPGEQFQAYLALQPSKLDKLYDTWRYHAFEFYLDWQSSVFVPNVSYAASPVEGYGGAVSAESYSNSQVLDSTYNTSPYNTSPYSGTVDSDYDDISISDSDSDETEGFNRYDPVHSANFEAMAKRGDGNALEMRLQRVGLSDKELDKRTRKQDLKSTHQDRIKATHFFDEGRNLDHKDANGALWDHSGAMPAKHMDAQYHGENQWASYRGATVEATDNQFSKDSDKPEERIFNRARVHYMGEEEQQKNTLAFKDGKAHKSRVPSGDSDSAETAPVHTLGASGVGTSNAQGADKHIFAMTKDGEFRTVDAWGEHKEEANEGPAPEGKEGHTLVTMNHSSLTAGDAVAAAGELRINDGTVEQLTDNTGHYSADNRMTHNALRTLEDSGVDSHNLTTRLFAGPKNKPVISSAREFKEAYAQAEGGLDPQTFHDNDARTKVAEGMRQKKDAMRVELEQAYRTREERMGRTVEDDEDASAAPPSAVEDALSSSSSRADEELAPSSTEEEEEILGSSSSEEDDTDVSVAALPPELARMREAFSDQPAAPNGPSARRMRALRARQAHNKKKDKRLFGRFSKKHRAKKLQREFADELEAKRNA